MNDDEDPESNKFRCSLARPCNFYGRHPLVSQRSFALPRRAKGFAWGASAQATLLPSASVTQSDQRIASRVPRLTLGGFGGQGPRRRGVSPTPPGGGKGTRPEVRATSRRAADGSTAEIKKFTAHLNSLSYEQNRYMRIFSNSL